MTAAFPFLAPIFAAVFCGWLVVHRGFQPARNSEALGVALGSLALAVFFVGIWAMITSKHRPPPANMGAVNMWDDGVAFGRVHMLSFLVGAVVARIFPPRMKRGRRRWIAPRPQRNSLHRVIGITLASFFGSFMMITGVGVASAALVEPSLRGGVLASGLAITCFALIWLVLILRSLQAQLHPRSSNAHDEQVRS